MIEIIVVIVIVMLIVNSERMKADNDDAKKSKSKSKSRSNEDDAKKSKGMSIDGRGGGKHICLCCLKDVSTTLRCSRCRIALYCGKACQLKHWPMHKNICQDSNTEDSDEKLSMKALNSSKQGNLIVHIITTITTNILTTT
jgi:hypothetical protein